LNAAILQKIRQIPAEVGAYYLDLTSGRTWGWKAEDDFPAASVIKVPIFLAVLQAAQAGRLSLDQKRAVTLSDHVGGAGVIFELHEGIELTLLDLCRLMIVISDNVASNLLLESLPEGELQSLFARLGMAHTVLGRRFMEMPRPGHDNRTTALDMGRCLAALARGEVVDKNHTHQALSVLRRQQFREKIPQRLPPELSVAHKTGELDGVRHDVALVEVPERPYVLCLLTQKGASSWLVDTHLAELSELVYEAHCQGLQVGDLRS